MKASDADRLSSIERKLDRLSAQVLEVHKLLHHKTNPHYVKVGAIKVLTGWTARKLEWARRNGVIEFKEGPEGIIYYNLDSLSPAFFKK